MKKAQIIKISLSVLAVTLATPVSGEAMQNQTRVQVLMAQAQARQRAEALAAARAQQALTQQQADAEALARQQAEALARQQAEALARQQAEALARQQAEALDRQQAEALARQQAEALARQQAEALARQQAEALDRQQAEALARQQAEALARQQVQVQVEPQKVQVQQPQTRVQVLMAQAQARQRAEALAAARVRSKVSEVKGIYEKKNLGLSEGECQGIATGIVVGGKTDLEAVVDVLKDHPLLVGRLQRIINDVVDLIVNHNQAIKAAWKLVCFDPVKETLQKRYTQFEIDIIDFMADQMVVKGAVSEGDALLNYFNDRGLKVIFCENNIVIAELMLKENLSCEAALKKGEKEAMRAQLTYKGGWACLKAHQLEGLINLCYDFHSIEKAEQDYIFSVTKLEDKWLMPFIQQVKYANLPFETVKSDYIQQTVVPNILREHYPHIDNNEVIVWIAGHVVKTQKKVEQLLKDKILDEDTVRGALQTKSMLLYGKQVDRNTATAMAKTLLTQNLTIAQVYQDFCIKEQAHLIKNKYQHLGDEDCYQLAMLGGTAENIQDALNFIFDDKDYDAEDIKEITTAILIGGKNFQDAEKCAGFRQLMSVYGQLNEDEAREIVDLKRQENLSDEEAIQGYMQTTFGLTPKSAHAAYSFLNDKADNITQAASMAEYVGKLDAHLKEKAFFKEQDRFKISEEEIWNIACEALENGEVGALAQFLGRRGIGHPTALYEIISDAYVLCMAKMLWNDNLPIGQSSAIMTNMEEGFKEQILNVFFFDPRQENQLSKGQQLQQWEVIFGRDSLSSLVPIMCYKNGVDFNRLDTFGSVKTALQKALPIFLQLRYPHSLIEPFFKQMELMNQWPMEQFDAFNEDKFKEFYESHYQLIADQMIDGKKNYHHVTQALTVAAGKEKEKLRNLFPYLRETHVIEISDASVYFRKDRQAQAIYRYLCENRDIRSDQMVIFGKNPKTIPEDDWQAYFKDFAQVLSLKERGESFEASVTAYQEFLKGREQKIAEKISRALGLPKQDCSDMIWNVSILKKPIHESMGQILCNHLEQLTIPALLLEATVLDRFVFMQISRQVNGILLEQRVQLKACQMIASAFGLKGLEGNLPPFEDVLQASLINFLNRDMNLLALPTPVKKEISKSLSKTVLGDGNLRTLPAIKQKESLKALKCEAVQEILKTKKTLFQEINFFQDIRGNEHPIAQIMVNDGCSFGEAFCQHKNIDFEKMPEFSTMSCFGDLVLLELKEEHFDLEGFTVSPQNLMGIAKTLSEKEGINIFEYDGKDIGCLYRQAYKWLPTQVIQKQKAQQIQLQKAHQNLQQKWNAFYRPFCQSMEDRSFDLHLMLAQNVYKLDEDVLLDPDGQRQLVKLNSQHTPALVKLNNAAGFRLVVNKNFGVDTMPVPERMVNSCEALFQQNPLLPGKVSMKLNDPTMIYIGSTGEHIFLNNWPMHPYHPVFSEEVHALTVQFMKVTQATQKVKININNLQYDPWCMASRYDTMPEVTTIQYEGLRNKILGSVTRYLPQVNILPEEARKRLHRIGRFFAWGDTSDKDTYLKGADGWGGDFGAEKPFVGAELKLWRKRVQLVCDQMIFSGQPTDQDVFENASYFYDPAIDDCVLGPQEALTNMEKGLPPMGEITLFHKVSHCLNSWKIQTLDTLVKKQIDCAMVENEYCRFARFLGKKTFSLQMAEEDMHNHGTLLLNKKGGLCLKPLVDEFLKSYQEDIISIVMNNVSYNPKPDNDHSYTIYQSDIVEWAGYHPAYCNVLESERLEELKDDAEFKEVVVCRILKDAGYIDWDERD